MTKNKFYITTPIYYVNAKPHLGSAYTTIAADVLARRHRMQGRDVFFLTGTDEHGGKIAESSKLEGKSPQEFVDNISAQFQFTWDTLNISNNNFIRTTNPEHIKAVEEVLKTLYDKGYFYKGAYRGFYCQDCEQFYTKTELEKGICPYHQKKLKIISEPCYFFKLSEFHSKLKSLIEKDEFEIKPAQRKNEILGFLNTQKLEDIAISRTKIKWGIPLPFDKEHTCYVWVDAFLNYLTGLGYKGLGSKVSTLRSSATAEDGQGLRLFDRFWPADVQLMAKDILRVHATIWPSLLLALGLPLPKKLFVHGFFTVNGQKMSKSLGNILDPVEISQEYGVDGLRYYLLAEIPFGKDGDVSIKRLKERYNSDLANGLGNLVSRVFTMAVKYQREIANDANRALKSATPEIANFSSRSWRDYEKAMADIQFHKALEACWKFIRACDGYIEQEKPWKLLKGSRFKVQGLRLNEVIYNLLESLRHIAWMILPFMPDTSKKIFDQLGIWESENDKPIEEARKWGGLKADIKVKKEGALFPRL